jgi:hypothetical protein
MALETLKGIEEIGGFKIVRVKPEEMSWDDFDKLRDEYPINITERLNCISFKIQNGPIKQNGVNGCQVDTLIETGQMNWKWFETEIRPSSFIYVRQDKNSLSFTIQNGPIKEVGVNGCQIDTLIETAKIIIEKLNENYPCPENKLAVIHLGAALSYLEERKLNREKRGVEGTNNV